MKYYNLCTTKPPPTNIAKLLELGSKFCYQIRNLNKTQFNEMINRLKYDIRVKHYVKNILRKTNDTMLKLYIKTKNPNIPDTPPLIEGAIKYLKKLFISYSTIENPLTVLI